MFIAYICFVYACLFAGIKSAICPRSIGKLILSTLADIGKALEICLRVAPNFADFVTGQLFCCLSPD